MSEDAGTYGDNWTDIHRCAIRIANLLRAEAQDTRTARLDRFAAAALTGLLANQTTQQGNTRVGIAAEACVQAECLLAARDAQDAEGGTR